LRAARYAVFEQYIPELWFLIYERSTLRPIGQTGFSQMQRVYQTAEFNISIGAKDCWGKGYGTEATRLMLRYAFATLGINMIWLRAQSSNQRAIRAYLRAGFRGSGCLREAQRIGQDAIDIVYMDCLAREFLVSETGSV
jgi:RimJ/RimL family protein N-acetyltransferase